MCIKNGCAKFALLQAPADASCPCSCREKAVCVHKKRLPSLIHRAHLLILGFLLSLIAAACSCALLFMLARFSRTRGTRRGLFWDSFCSLGELTCVQIGRVNLHAAVCSLAALSRCPRETTVVPLFLSMTLRGHHVEFALARAPVQSDWLEEQPTGVEFESI